MDGAFSSLRREPECRRVWTDYCVIADAVRHESQLHRDLTGSIMARIAQEPVVFAPPRRVGRPWRAVAAMAASLAGVAVVGWVSLTMQESREGPRLAEVPRFAKVEPSDPADRQRMQEYLVAHQSQAAGLPFMGAAHNIRSVAAKAGSGSR